MTLCHTETALVVSVALPPFPPLEVSLRRGSWGKSSEASFRQGDSFRDRSHIAQQDGGMPRRPSGPPCAGPCNSRWRKAQEALDAHAGELATWEKYPVGAPPAEPEVPAVSPWPGDPIFCGRCQAVIRRELAELDDLASIRAAHADGHRKGPGADRVSGSRTPPSPSAAVDDVDELASMLRGWESVARGADDTPPRRGYLAQEITTVCSWLVAHFDILICREDVATEFAGEIRQWHKRLRETEKAGTGRHSLPLPCHRCGQKSLEVEDGAKYVECVNRDWQGMRCGVLMSRTEYETAFAQWAARKGREPPPVP